MEPLPGMIKPIPELAGIATYREAALIGWSVEENVERLLRLQWTERRLMQALVAHLPAMPAWETKCAMALHQWQCAEHVEMIRQRIGEMRSPVPNLDSPPEKGCIASLDETFDGLHQWPSGIAVGLLYQAVIPALA